MDPSPSQGNMPINHPSIFVNKDGSSIQVFAEACSIKGRPKLMRTLRNFGASLCCDPKSAQVILVDQETTDGKKFIRNWGRDKVVLHYLWAKKSIQEGKALLKDCNWGECLTADDGLPIETEDTDEPGLDKSPLPTPRVTPVEYKATRPTRASHLSNSAPIEQNLVAQAPLSTDDIATTLISPNLTQAMPPTSPMPINPTDSFPQTPYTMQMPNMTMPPPMMMAQIAQYMMMMNSSNYPYNSQAQPTDFNLALIDALRIHNGQWSNSQAPPQASPNVYDHRTVNRPSTEQNYQYLNPSSNSFTVSDSQSTLMERPARKRHRASSASSDSIPMQNISQRKSKTASLAPKASPSAAQPSSERGLFQSKSGKELSFFVQVEMHNRSAVVAAIKKHGGKIEGNNEIADYAILASGATKTKTFKDLLLSTVAAGRPALSARFVHESVAQNTLLDPRDFAFESPPIKTRKRPVTVTQDDDSSDESERRRLAKNAREMVRRQRLKEEAAQLSTPPQKKKGISRDISTSLLAHSGPPSPTPPPEHTREAVGNNFKFTDSERIYSMKYAQVLLARDHEISSTAIGTALHNKIPHHTSNSWRRHLSTPSVRDEMDHLRKRAGIAFRKAQDQKQSQATLSVPEVRQQDKSESELEDPAITPITPSSTLVDESEADKKMAEEEDLTFIAAFFVANVNDNEEESAIWDRLTSQATCKTAGSWEEFYNMHHEEVVRRYEKMCASDWQPS